MSSLNQIPINERPVNEISLSQIRVNERTYEVCLDAVSKPPTPNVCVLKFVPEKHKTFELCSEAVKVDGLALWFVPSEFFSTDPDKTCQMCLNAVTQNGQALDRVPEHIRDRYVCLAAVKQDGNALQFVPEAIKKIPEVRLAAVKQNGWALAHLPQQLRGVDVCTAAVYQKPSAFQYVPKIQQTLKFCLLMASHNVECLEFIPDKVTQYLNFWKPLFGTGKLDEDRIPEEFRSQIIFRPAKAQRVF